MLCVGGGLGRWVSVCVLDGLFSLTKSCDIVLVALLRSGALFFGLYCHSHD